jgi:hypothetical protein
MENLSSSHYTFLVREAYPLDKNTIEMLNAPNNALAGALKQQHPMEPLSGNKHNMRKMHIIVKATLLPPILWVVQIICHRS